MTFTRGNKVQIVWKSRGGPVMEATYPYRTDSDTGLPAIHRADTHPLFPAEGTFKMVGRQLVLGLTEGNVPPDIPTPNLALVLRRVK